MLSLKLIIHKAPYLLILLLLTTVSDKVFAQKLDSKLENFTAIDAHTHGSILYGVHA